MDKRGSKCQLLENGEIWPLWKIQKGSLEEEVFKWGLQIAASLLGTSPSYVAFCVLKKKP